MTDKTPSTISVKNVWKSYGTLNVLRGLSLEVLPGETVVILGRSGAGKSVTLKLIMGLERPDSGTIEVEGKPVSDMSATQRFRSVSNLGMLFQSSALFDSMTVEENCGFFLTQHPDRITQEWVKPKDLKERVDHALELVGLEGTQKKMPSDLSGGMRRRAALARLIVYRPNILLYDEPTTGLDPLTAMQINELIRKTQHELQATSIVVTHDLRSALEVGDRIALHHEGVIALTAKTHEFFHLDDPRVKAFIDNTILPPEYSNPRRNHAGPA